MTEVSLINLGKLHYKEAYEIQKRLHDELLTQENCPGYLLMVEHYPVFTLGGDHKTDDFLYPIEQIRSEGIEIEETNRGGNITYHGPGQMVAYPLLNLAYFQKDIRWYVNVLEEWIICSLKQLGISASRKTAYRGVWVGDEKICAIGIAIRKWVTMHGIALNVCTDLVNFSKINPCGITEFGVTSMEKLGHNADMKLVMDVLVEEFPKIFQCKLKSITLEEVNHVEHS